MLSLFQKWFLRYVNFLFGMVPARRLVKNIDKNGANKIILSDVDLAKLWITELTHNNAQQRSLVEIVLLHEDSAEMWELVKTNFDFNNTEHDVLLRRFLDLITMHRHRCLNRVSLNNWLVDAWMFLFSHYIVLHPGMLNTNNVFAGSPLYMKLFETYPHTGQLLTLGQLQCLELEDLQSYFAVVFPEFDFTHCELFVMLSTNTPDVLVKDFLPSFVLVAQSALI